MFVTCSECETMYKVDERLLGQQGRKVRCTECDHMWVQEPPPPEEGEETPEPTEKPEWMDDDEEETALDFRTVVKGQYFNEDEIDIPQAVKPAPETEPVPAEFEIPVMEYRPLGMAAGQFGVFVFLLLSFVSLSTLFLFKKPVVSHYPAMAHFYKTIGFALKAPGEGLALSDMTAESMAGNGSKRVLNIGARLANISDKKMSYPKLQVRLKGAYGGVLKTWEFEAEDRLELASGQSVPVDLTFKDAPGDGRTVELQVVDR